MVASSDGINHWEDWTEQEIMEKRTEVEGVLRKHYWSDSVVITDDIKSAKEYMKKVAETELWQGELGAYTLKVGCYLVRIAERLYSIYEPGYIPEMEQPISREDTEAIKKELSGCGKFGMLKNVRFTSELSARHCKTFVLQANYRQDIVMRRKMISLLYAVRLMREMIIGLNLLNMYVRQKRIGTFLMSMLR